MAASPSVQRCISVPHDSTDNRFKCDPGSPVHGENIEPENEIRRSKFRLQRSHAVLHRQFQKQILFHSSSKAFNRRRFTFSSQSEYKVLCKKRRRYTSVALPTKFLLGGNIKDPLNLGSMEDEKINQQLNAFSPASSPLPVSQHRTQVKLLIPPNIYDPLNLNTGEEIEFNLLSSKHRKRRRHRKNRKDDAENSIETHQMSSAKVSDSDSIQIARSPTLTLPLEECAPKELKLDCSICSNSSDERSSSDKIVSPVVPQGSLLKFHKPAVKQIAKRRRTKSRLLQKVETKKYRANAEKFCYGNHVTNHANWNFGNETDEDPRLRYFSKDLFCRKDVLDIGCNTGILTLDIAKQWYPRKIIGIDIDKKLINIAQRKVRNYSNVDFDEGINFPQSMAAMYGTLAKFNISNLDSSSEFPNNVTFFEANYVPGGEDYLETQKPEFDTILCLRVTKWIHLNFGDEGLKMAFKRMFAQLRIGGHLILEPQPWFTYAASKRITPSIYKTYCSLTMKPEDFCDFLLSKEVGFSSCELIGRTYNCTKVYRQPLYLFTKGFHSDESTVDMGVHTFHNDEWNSNTDEQSEAAHDWAELEALNHNTVTNSNVEH